MDQEERLRDLLDEVLRAQDTTTCAQIDASACQTQSDWRRAHRAEESLEEAKELFVRRVLQLFRDGA